MAISVFSAAKYLADRSGWALTNLKIQKILYLAHMAYMAEHDGEPLIDDEFEAWQYGPVCPPLYHELKIYGGSPVDNIFHQYDMPEENSDEAQALEQAYDSFGSLSGGKLIALTHQEGGAWEKHWNPDERDIPIPNEDILQEYEDIFAQ